MQETWDTSAGVDLHLEVSGGGVKAGLAAALRTAVRTGSIGALCLAFPLQPPARAGAPTHAAPGRQILAGAP